MVCYTSSQSFQRCGVKYLKILTPLFSMVKAVALSGKRGLMMGHFFSQEILKYLFNLFITLLIPLLSNVIFVNPIITALIPLNHNVILLNPLFVWDYDALSLHTIILLCLILLFFFLFHRECYWKGRLYFYVDLLNLYTTTLLHSIQSKVSGLLQATI